MDSRLRQGGTLADAWCTTDTSYEPGAHCGAMRRKRRSRGSSPRACWSVELWDSAGDEEAQRRPTKLSCGMCRGRRGESWVPNRTGGGRGCS
jgi:hypothetical protein